MDVALMPADLLRLMPRSNGMITGPSLFRQLI